MPSHPHPHPYPYPHPGKTSIGPVIQHMWDQEKEHKAKFEELVPKYRVRPTALLPIWNVAGFMLGAGECLARMQYTYR